MTTVGIDIGGTKTAVGLFENQKLMVSEVRATGSFDRTLNDIASIMLRWRDGISFDAIGIACSGPLDLEKGVVLNGATLEGWFGRPIVEVIRSRFSVPTTLLNDADAALLGELFDESNPLRPSEPVLMLTFGTGVGGAFWDGCMIYSGAFGEHPELGHIGVDPGGPLCYCGLNGCLEAMASGLAINDIAVESGFDGIDDLSELALTGNQLALHLMSQVKNSITQGLVTLTHTFRPSCFILGGGVMEKLHRFIAPITVPVNATTVPGPAPMIRLATLGNRAGMFGASVAAMRHLNDI